MLLDHGSEPQVTMTFGSGLLVAVTPQGLSLALSTKKVRLALGELLPLEPTNKSERIEGGEVGSS